MLSKIRNRLLENENRGPTSVIARFPTRNSNEQLKASQAELIRSYHAVPDAFKDFFVDSKQDFPYTVFTPSYEIFIRRTTEKLICDFGKEIYVLEKSGTGFEASCYPVERISYVETKTILLDSSIKISGVTKDGNPNSSTFRYNSLTDYLFTPILKRMRRTKIDSETRPNRLELEKFDSWKGINFKFMSYAKRSLLAEEKVIHTILQPEIRETVLQALGRTYHRVLAPTLACILTNQELIMIQEEKFWSGDDKYGGIWDYIPLNKIMMLSLKEKEKSLLEFTVQLTEGTHLEYLFQSSARRDINRIQYHFNQLMIT